MKTPPNKSLPAALADGSSSASRFTLAGPACLSAGVRRSRGLDIIRTPLNSIFLLRWLLLAGCAHNHERFILTAQLLPPKVPRTALRLAMELKNVSGQPQRVVALEDFFEGSVFLRAVNGEVHEFLQSNYFHMALTATWIPTTVTLTPGSSCRWEHSLSEFIDWHRSHVKFEHALYVVAVPVLSTEFQRGGQIWCKFDVRQWKQLGKNCGIYTATAKVVSTRIPYPAR